MKRDFNLRTVNVTDTLRLREKRFFAALAEADDDFKYLNQGKWSWGKP
jgi:hypothetical protein